MVILLSQNKITDFLMISAWACPFKYVQAVMKNKLYITLILVVATVKIFSSMANLWLTIGFITLMYLLQNQLLATSGKDGRNSVEAKIRRSCLPQSPVKT